MATSMEQEVMPLAAEFGPAGFQPYVLDLELLGFTDAEAVRTMTFVVLMRQGGALLALPEGVLARDTVFAGNVVGSQEASGPSTRVEVSAAVLDEEALQMSPELMAGHAVNVLLIDASTDVLAALTQLESKEELADIILFDVNEPLVIPLPDELVLKAQEWVHGSEVEPPARVQFYSADEVPETPPPEPQRRSARRKAPGVGTTGEKPTASPKKRPTVAQLADSLSEITAALPIRQSCRS
eukprot:s233_g3.t1